MAPGMILFYLQPIFRPSLACRLMQKMAGLRDQLDTRAHLLPTLEYGQIKTLHETISLTN